MQPEMTEIIAQALRYSRLQDFGGGWDKLNETTKQEWRESARMFTRYAEDRRIAFGWKNDR